MLRPANTVQVYLYAEPVDMRKSITEYMEQVRPGMATLESGEALFLGMTEKRIQKSAVSDLVSYYFKRSGIGIQGSCHKIRHASAPIC